MADEPQVPTKAEPKPEPTPGAAEAEKPKPEPTIRLVEGEEEDREPGGDDPQAIRARKEYRARKRAQDDLQREREARIAAEARAKALEEARQKEERPKRYTADQVQKAVEAGQITQAEAMDYIAETKAQAVTEAVEKRRLEREKAERPISEAQREMGEYLEAKPGLRDKSDPKFNEVARVYQELTSRYGMPDNLVTEVLALKQVYGPVNQLRASREVRDMTREAADLHAEAGAGGGSGGKGGNSGDPLAGVPQRYIDFWKSRGMSAEEMKKEAKYIPRERLSKDWVTLHEKDVRTRRQE